MSTNRPNADRPHRGAASLLALLGGADNDVLDVCSEERKRFVWAGVTLLSAVVIATASMGVMLHIAFRWGPGWALMGGFAWGLLVIGPIDAYLVAVLRRQHNRLLTLATAVPRLMLAGVISSVVAVGLSLAAFAPEINAQLGFDQVAAMTTFEQGLAVQPDMAAIPGLEAQIASLQGVVAVNAPPDPFSDPTVVALNRQLRQVQTQYFVAEAHAGCEYDGSCGSHEVGAGPAWRADMSIVSQLGRQVSSIEAQLKSAEQGATDATVASQRAKTHEAATELPLLQGQLATLEQERNSEISNERRQIAASAGLSARLEALWHLSQHDPAAAVFHLMVMLLLAGLETVPVLTKTVLLLGDPTTYDQIAGLRDGARLIQSKEAFEKETELARQLINEEMQLTLQANRAVGKVLVDAWEERAKQHIEANIDQYVVF
jgi:hypothetical protein